MSIMNLQYARTRRRGIVRSSDPHTPDSFICGKALSRAWPGEAAALKAQDQRHPRRPVTPRNWPGTQAWAFPRASLTSVCLAPRGPRVDTDLREALAHLFAGGSRLIQEPD